MDTQQLHLRHISDLSHLTLNDGPLWCCSDEEELKNSVLPEEDVGDCATLRSKANPFQDVPLDKKASVAKEGFLQRKLHADIDGKRSESA